MLLDYQLGQGSIVLRVKLRSTTSPFNGLTGLTSASSGLVISSIADNEATPTSYTQAGSTIETIATLGTFAAPTATKCRFKEVDATKHPGIYEVQVADARFAVTSAKSLLISFSGVSGLAECDVLVPLRSVNPYDVVRGGMTALPNAAAEAANGLYTRGTGAGQINQPANGMIDANVVRNAGTAITAAAGIQEVKVASIANDAITAAAIATDAIGSAELAASAVTEIQSGLSTLDAAGVRTAVGLGSANLDTQLGAIAGYIDTEVAAIKAKTDNLPASPANEATLTTIAGYVDTEVAAIKAKTDQLTFTNANKIDATVTAITAGTITSAAFTVSAITGVATGILEKLDQLWRRFFKKATMTATQAKTYADDNTTVLTTQTVSDDLTTQVQGPAS